MHQPTSITETPISAICLLCRNLEDLLPFYTDRMGFQVRRREESFVQFHRSYGVNLCLWTIGHIKQHIGFEVWPEGDRVGKIACTVRTQSKAEIDQLYARLTGTGVNILHQPKVYPWNVYAIYFADPDGNCWEIYHWLDGGPKGDVYQAAGMKA